jgi:hypothetical protein
MAICHTVQRGDSLWSLAYRYLGSGAKWRTILEHHNREAAKPGRHKLLLPIEDPNLIYVSQHIMIPGNRRNLSPKIGTKQEASRIATPIDLKITYAIGRDTPPMVYVHKGLGYTVTTEISGEIAVELRSADRFRHNLELLMSKNPTEAKHKLQQNYDPALCALTAKPGIEFESGRVTIKPAIAAEAGLGPYRVEVQAESPVHFSGKLKPTKVEGTIVASGREYKYSADLEFKVNVILEPKPRDKVKIQVEASMPRKEPAGYRSENTMDLQQFVSMVSWTIVGIALILFGYKQLPVMEGTSSITPFAHPINPNNPRNQRFFNNNA